MGAPAAVIPDLPDVLKRYLDGASVTELAKDSRVARRTLYRHLLAALGEDGYHEAVTHALVARIADADEELEAARRSGDPVRVSAAREACRFYRMDFERRRPSLYGVKQTNVNVTAVVADADLVGTAARLLERLSEPKALPEKVVEGEVVER